MVVFYYKIVCKNTNIKDMLVRQVNLIEKNTHTVIVVQIRQQSVMTLNYMRL